MQQAVFGLGPLGPGGGGHGFGGSKGIVSVEGALGAAQDGGGFHLPLSGGSGEELDLDRKSVV